MILMNTAGVVASVKARVGAEVKVNTKIKLMSTTEATPERELVNAMGGVSGIDDNVYNFTCTT